MRYKSGFLCTQTCHSFDSNKTIRAGQCKCISNSTLVVTHSRDVLVEINWKADAVVVGLGRLQKTVCRRTKIDAELHLSTRCQTNDICRWKVSSSYSAVANFLTTRLWLGCNGETAIISDHTHSITPYIGLQICQSYARKTSIQSWIRTRKATVLSVKKNTMSIGCIYLSIIAIPDLEVPYLSHY